MADLATLLAQLNQNAYIMENIVKAIHIPENNNQAGLAHCREYLGRALDHMIKVGDAFRAISKQHPQDLNTHDVRNASAKQEHLAAQFRVLTTTLRERTPTRPKHSTVNPSALGQSVLTNAPTTKTKQLKDTIIQANVKYDQLRLDLGQLATSVTARKWTRSEDHIVTLGMKYRSAWRDQHATISRKLIEIDGLAKLHNLTDLQDRIVDTSSEVMALSTRINLIILEIEATHRMITAYPIKSPSYSGDTSEDSSPSRTISKQQLWTTKPLEETKWER